VDLFAASTSKGFGRRTYRKVACVEEFFDIIYNVHRDHTYISILKLVKKVKGI